MSVLCIIMPPGVAPVYNCIESWAKYEELSIASIFKKSSDEQNSGSKTEWRTPWKSQRVGEAAPRKTEREIEVAEKPVKKNK